MQIGSDAEEAREEREEEEEEEDESSEEEVENKEQQDDDKNKEAKDNTQVSTGQFYIDVFFLFFNSGLGKASPLK